LILTPKNIAGAEEDSRHFGALAIMIAMAEISKLSFSSRQQHEHFFILYLTPFSTTTIR